MRFLDDLRVRMIQATARWTVRYGEELRFAGGDLPAPEVRRVATRHGEVPVHVYRGRAEGAAYVHLHGGAWLMRHPAMDDWWCRYLVATTGVTVHNVDFRVAPQVRYAVAQEEAHDVAAHVARDARVVVGGFSSGGGMAAAVCLMARDDQTFQPRLQVLGVPALDLASEVRDAPGMISPDLRCLVRRVYFPDAERRGEPYASPLLAADLSGLPPAVVMTAERDVLRAEGDAYAARLAAAGVPVVHDVTPRADHYFLTEDPTRARTTMAMVAAKVEDAVLTG